MKPGDKIACTDSTDTENLRKGATYTVMEVERTGANVKLEEIPDYWYPANLFKPVATVRGDNNGGSTDYYKLPEGAKDLQDLIEHKDMSFAQGNIFKAAYRLTDKHLDLEYDLNKILWFAQRMLEEIKCG